MQLRNHCIRTLFIFNNHGSKARCSWWEDCSLLDFFKRHIYITPWGDSTEWNVDNYSAISHPILFGGLNISAWELSMNNILRLSSLLSLASVWGSCIMFYRFGVDHLAVGSFLTINFLAWSNSWFQHCCWN